MDYTEMSNNGQQGVGMMPKPAQMPAHIPSYWMPYFMVTDVDASAATAKQHGAKVMVGPIDIPNVGRFAIVSDPQDAVFAIFKSARG
jgi:predicted enzyme related to lactoylglutathione lyase